jgi:signal transduction histidine kinase
MFPTTYRYSLMIIAASLVCGVAVLAALNLWYLRKLQSRDVHTTAAQAVLDFGMSMARHLSMQVASESADDSISLRHLQKLLLALKEVEPSLQYVSITEGDLTLFHEDLSSGPTRAVTHASAEDILIGRRLLASRGEVVPVLTFSAPIPGAAASARRLHLALKREAVSQREAQASAVLSLMFRLSITTLIVAFLLAILFIAWILRHEMVFQQRQRDAEHLTFAGILANGIIHDIRNPMSSLKLDVQMLQKESDKGEAGHTGRIRELTERACKTMDRLDAVMREFLFVSKPESTVWEAVDVNACVRDCLDLLQSRFDRDGVNLIGTLDETRLFISGHDVGLKRAITNVLTNAAQVSPRGGTVTVATGCLEGNVRITIEDEGPGVSPREAARIFDMFVSGTPGGVGLGLYLARVAIGKLSGRIAVENRPTGGARFIITLPRAAVGTPEGNA